MAAAAATLSNPVTGLDLNDTTIGRRVRRGCLAATLLIGAGAPGARPADAQQTDELTFVVIGHPRGGRDSAPHARLDELVSEVRAARPDLVFLTGDLIWGSVEEPRADSALILREWAALDSALATLEVPVYRVPGNHDIHDPVTRDIYRERYGAYPRVLDRGNTRFLLLNTTFVPEGDEPTPVKRGKTVRLDSAQVAFVREALADGDHEHAFVLAHHVLWWRRDAPWWTDVHPALVEGGVRAVFAGDVGPTMFTHLERDGVQYLRSTLNAIADGPVRGSNTVARALWALPTLQLETFVRVTVRGEDVAYDVEAVGALTSGAFSPDRWREVFGADPAEDRYYDPEALEMPSAPEPGLATRVWDAIGTPRRLGALGAVIAFAFVAGWLFGGARARRGHAK